MWEGVFAKKISGAGFDSQERNRQIRHTFGMQVVSIASRPQWEASETAGAPPSFGGTPHAIPST